MAVSDFSDVTLVSADPALLLCWEEQVRQGLECSLLLKHSRGKISTILTTSKSVSPEPKAPRPSHSHAEKKKKSKNKGGKKKRLERLLSYHQRLVEERGLPPSRLMLKHAATPPSPSTPDTIQKPDQEDEQFKCEQCEYISTTKQDVDNHRVDTHRESYVSKTKKVINCKHCTFTAHKRKDMETHKKSVHAMWTCSLCETVFIVSRIEEESVNLKTEHLNENHKDAVHLWGHKFKINCSSSLDESPVIFSPLHLSIKSISIKNC